MSEELAGFLESGLSLTLGVRDGDLWPDGARAWALRVHEDRSRLTVFVQNRDAAALLPGLADHPQVALCCDRPTDSRACQLKGVFVAARRARPAERALVQTQVEVFLDELAIIGIPRSMTAGWRWWPCQAFDVVVEQVYEQTPGPGAGEPLSPAAGP